MDTPVIVGTPVHYYTRNPDEQSNSAGMGPYYGIVTQIFESEQGYANLYVFPPFKAPYHAGSVPVREAAFAEMVGIERPARWYEPMQVEQIVTVSPGVQEVMSKLDAAIDRLEGDRDLHGDQD